MTRWLLRCGIAGPVVFIVVFLVLGATRPDYDPVWTFVSQLSLDGGGEWQIANFLVSGLLMAGFALGLSRMLGAGSAWQWLSIALIGAGFIALGIFRDDPMLRYPPGPHTPAGISWPVQATGRAHLVLGGIGVMGGLLAATLTWAWRFAKQGRKWWYAYSVVSAILLPVLYVAALVSGYASNVPEAPLSGYAGLLQRASLTTGLAWIAVLASHHLCGPQTSDPP